MRMVNQLLEVSSTDPDDARRRKLLNILLLGMFVMVFLGMLAAVGFLLSEGVNTDILSLLRATLFTLVGILAIFEINRYWSGQLASLLFVLLLTIALAFSDEPSEVVNGRSTFLFTVPILMASVTLRPWSSFIMASVSSMVIAYLDTFILHSTPGIPTMLGFFAVAFVAWLSAQSLEGALKDVRVINRELDQRVVARTHELQDANLQLEEANEHLKELDRLKSHFVAMVSHELRTPLNAIQGFTEMLQSGIYGTLGEKPLGALGRVNVNLHRLLALVNDLLDRARIEAGQMSLKIAPFAPRELAGEVYSSMVVLAESKMLELQVEVADNVPETLHGDQHRLQQILINLVGNAVKFTDKGGVYVQVSRPDPTHWAMSVTDTGCGIPADAREYIFEPFRQVDSSLTREYEGTGMGLSIVKQLTELMGGGLELESEVGQGSTFLILLPIVSENKEV